MENCRTPNKEQRLKVYKKALNIIENGNKPPGHITGYKLCLLLPVILWKLKHFLNDAPDGSYWLHTDTHEIFPELTRNHVLKINNIMSPKDYLRIKILKEIIKSLED